MTEAKVDFSKLDYEQALRQLEQVTAQLESEQLPLEKMLELYARGQALAGRCNQLLDSAELQLTKLNANGKAEKLSE